MAKRFLVLTGDILRKAADTHLKTGTGDDRSDDVDVYSCCAVDRAEPSGDSYEELWQLLQEMDIPAFGAFEDIPKGPERQAARFLWLDFLALVLDDNALDD